MSDLLYGDLCFQVVGAAMEVHRVLGPGFLEAVYESALARELQLRNIPFRRQVGIEVTYKDLAIGEYRIDLLVDEKVVLEIKAVSTLTAAHEAQAHHLPGSDRHAAGAASQLWEFVPPLPPNYPVKN